MSRESENAMKAMKKYLEENGAEDMSIDEMNSLLQKFTMNYNSNLPGRVTEKTAKTADDYLELAERTTNRTKAEKYIKTALELEPDNLDAVNASLEWADGNSWEYYQKLSGAIQNATDLMEKKGFMDENSIGEFWSILETRPYMRLLERYVEYLTDMGMMNLAAKKCEEMIRLCRNDNLGIRFQLMHIYAFLEQEEPALELHEKYNEFEEAQMLLPLCVLYFKKGDFDKAEEYLKRLSDVNKETKKFFRAIKRDKLQEHIKEISSYGYQPFTIQELIVAKLENNYLYETTPLFMDWAYEKLRKQ